jgi:hypothetical protein
MIRVQLYRPKRKSTNGWVLTFTALFLVLLASTLSSAREEIIDGEAIDETEFPAVFVLKMTPSGLGDESESLCTSFLVHPRLLLTAAHCLTHISGIESASNGARVGKGTSLAVGKYNANPIYTESTRSEANSPLIGASDIGYVLLKKDVEGISPIEVSPSIDSHDRAEWQGKQATLVGYGASVWKENGTYTVGAPPGAGTKRIGTKTISNISNLLIYLDGIENGTLPGDSGGPLFLNIDGRLQAIALHHMKSDHEISVPKHRFLSKKIKPGKFKKASEYSHSIETPLSVENLCWVEKDSGIDIPGVDCR